MAQKVIVLRNGEYLIDTIIDDISPKDLILSYPKHNSSKSMILKNRITITLTKPFAYNEGHYITTTYRDTKIDVLPGGIEKVHSIILTYKDYTISELDGIIKKINDEENNQSISTLEMRIQELEAEKCNLEDEVNELKKIKDSANKIIEYAEKFKNAIETTDKVES